jgi:hypothetical protein
VHSKFTFGAISSHNYKLSVKAKATVKPLERTNYIPHTTLSCTQS